MQVVDAVDGDLFAEVLQLGATQLHVVLTLLVEPPAGLYNLRGKDSFCQPLAYEELNALRPAIYYEFLQTLIILDA